MYFDRTGLPEFESFIRFKPPTTNIVRDAHGQALIELAREYRRVVTYDEAPRSTQAIRSEALRSIQEGLRGVVRLSGGAAHSLSSRNFPIAVMGKTGTSSAYRDALFVGATYGTQGITVAGRHDLRSHQYERPCGQNARARIVRVGGVRRGAQRRLPR